MHEGQHVIYVGEEREGIRPGDQGRILMTASATAMHVQWETGDRASSVYLVDSGDLSVRGHVSSLLPQAEADDADSLEYQSLSSFAARRSYDSGGEVGLLEDMAAMGHLECFGGLAEEVCDFVAGRLRTDPAFRSVLSQLDEPEGESLLRIACVALLRDAAHVEEG